MSPHVAPPGAGRALVERLGLPILGLESGHDLKLACLACGSSDGLRVHVDRGVGYCHPCGAKYSPARLALAVVGNADAAQVICREVGILPPLRERRKKPSEVAASAPLDLATLRGVSRENWRRWGLHQEGASFVVVPVFGPDGQPCSEFQINAAGKGKLARGKPAGVFLPSTEGTPQVPKAGETWAVVEGAKDAAALFALGILALGLPGNRLPEKFAPLLRGVHVVLVPDRDASGQRGAAATAAVLQGVAASIRVAKLPLPLVEKGGGDCRDVLKLEGGETLLRQVIADASPWEPDTCAATAARDRGEISNLDPALGESKIARHPDQIIADVLRLTGGWPRRVGSALFVVDANHGLGWLESTAALFGWLRRTVERVRWSKDDGCLGQADLFAELRRTADRYLAVEEIPHEPPMAGHYYLAAPSEPGDGSHLAALLERFCPASDIDRELIRALLATVVWGGPAGTRPAFAITSVGGRGKGKTSLVEMLAHLAGGLLDFSAAEEIGSIKSRLLSPDALTKRVALLDNLKSARLSWAELEALITAPTISGRRLYVGEATRPNTLTFCLTLNGPSMAPDMAQRCVFIRLGEPARSGAWKEETLRYIDTHRTAILADLIGWLRGPRQPPERFTRWASWEADTLSRLNDPEAVQAEILRRQGESDVEAEEGELIERYFADRLAELTYDPIEQIIFIPSRQAAAWFNAATLERHPASGAARRLKQMADEGRVKSIRYHRTGAERGFIWVGPCVTPGTPTQWDIETRIKFHGEPAARGGAWT